MADDVDVDADDDGDEDGEEEEDDEEPAAPSGPQEVSPPSKLSIQRFSREEARDQRIEPLIYIGTAVLGLIIFSLLHWPLPIGAAIGPIVYFLISEYLLP